MFPKILDVCCLSTFLFRLIVKEFLNIAFTAILAFHIRTLIPVLCALLLILFPANVPGKAAKNGLNTCALATNVVDPERVLSYSRQKNLFSTPQQPGSCSGNL